MEEIQEQFEDSDMELQVNKIRIQNQNPIRPYSQGQPHQIC